LAVAKGRRRVSSRYKTRPPVQAPRASHTTFDGLRRQALQVGRLAGAYTERTGRVAGKARAAFLETPSARANSHGRSLCTQR
jgi:hypothetical protein